MSKVSFRNVLEMREDGCVPKLSGIGDVVDVEYRVSGLSTMSCTGKIFEIGSDYLIVDCSSSYHSDIRNIPIATLNRVEKFGGRK